MGTPEQNTPQVADAAAAAGPAPHGEPVPGVDIQPMPFLISVPDLRNGALINIQQAAPRASMSVLYHWTVIDGLPYERAIDAVEMTIRAVYAQMLHVAGGTVAPAMQTEVRRRAIVLGAVRAGAQASYKLGANDMTIAEMISSGARFHNGRIEQKANGGTSAGRWTAMQGMAGLTDVETQVVGVCAYIGMGVPVLQGVSLVMTGHHYIPTTYNLFGGIKRQALGSTTVEVRNWVEAMGDEFNDMAFHKACHPISPTLKRSLAKSTDVAARLKASGHGSVAIRLPAMPSEASGGKAAVALIRSASTTIAQMGHSVSSDDITTLLLALEAAEEGPQEAARCDEVVLWLARNSSQLAFCAGIVQQVHETTGSGKNTILAAFSVRRIMADNPADVARGMQYARAAATRTRTAMEAGSFPDPNLTL
jgi:hypothetical protein